MIKSYMLFKVFKVLVLLYATLPLHAARPLINDDASTVEMHKYEMEVAADYWKDQAQTGLTFKHGLTERMDLGISFGYCALPQDLRAFSHADIGFKFALMLDLIAASFKICPDQSLYTINGILSKELSFLNFDLNFGMKALGESNEGNLTY